uniref:fimbrial protein n=1 Tax=uncultured Vibrio sp. TaxID=114054 RepID=UPI0034E1BA06
IADPNVVDNTVLLSTGTSDGVGLQITHNSQVMELGENIQVLSNVPDGNVSLPFEVSYIRVSRDLYVGSVNSVATFTISYP